MIYQQSNRNKIQKKSLLDNFPYNTGAFGFVVLELALLSVGPVTVGSSNTIGLSRVSTSEPKHHVR